MNRLLLCMCAFCFAMFSGAGAVDLNGATYVNMTSDTAASAKQKAFNSAQREVIIQVLRNYANPEQLDEAVKNSTNEDLMNIVSSSSVAAEKISDTTYSANISFVIDSDAAKSWLEKYSVQNWLPTSDAVVKVPENFVVVTATLLQPVADWANLNQISRDIKIDLATTKVVGNNVFFNVSDKDVAKLSGALRGAGWSVRQVDGGLKIWK